MKRAGTYSKLLDMQIETLAGALVVIEKCQEEINSEDFNPVMMKVTRDGEQPVENPVLKTHSRYMSEMSRQMKLLKLTVDDVVGKPDIPDEADRVQKEMSKIEDKKICYSKGNS